MTTELFKRDQVAQIVGSVLQRVTRAPAIDSTLLHEVEQLKTVIEQMRAELSIVHPGQIQSRIPSATDDLDAIVTTTEAATHTIMNACEVIQGLMEHKPLEESAQIENEIIRIVEACTFQDLTGQRITKTIKLLREIDQRADELWQILKNNFSDLECKDNEKETPFSLMNGPQLPGQGVSQTDIDSLLNDLF